MDKWLAIRKSLGNTWEVVAYTGAVLQTGIYLSSYFDAYDYIRAYTSSFQGLRPVVLKEDGTEWILPKRNS